MLKHALLRAEGLLIVEPQSPLESTDFDELVKEVDPYLAERGQLNGLLIYVGSFPGWNDFANGCRSLCGRRNPAFPFP